MRLIDADVLIDHLEEVMETAKHFGNTEVSDTLCGVIGVIKGEKTIERPHGEWILDAVSPCSISWFRCSYCGYKYEAYKQSNFCPNCGADMRKEGDGE